MQSRDEITQRVQAFKIKLGAAEEQDEHVVAALHLHAQHQLAVEVAQDRTSRGGNDHGIDAWHFDSREGILFIYQSKLSTGKTMAAAGFNDLNRAAEWLGDTLASGNLESVPTSPCIYNLVQMLAQHREDIRVIWFRLISPFDHNELDDLPELTEARQSMATSALNRYAVERGIKLKLDATEYNLEEGVIHQPTQYTLGRVRE